MGHQPVLTASDMTWLWLQGHQSTLNKGSFNPPSPPPQGHRQVHPAAWSCSKKHNALLLYLLLPKAYSDVTKEKADFSLHKRLPKVDINHTSNIQTILEGQDICCHHRIIPNKPVLDMSPFLLKRSQYSMISRKLVYLSTYLRYVFLWNISFCQDSWHDFKPSQYSAMTTFSLFYKGLLIFFVKSPQQISAWFPRGCCCYISHSFTWCRGKTGWTGGRRMGPPLFWDLRYVQHV